MCIIEPHAFILRNPLALILSLLVLLFTACSTGSDKGEMDTPQENRSKESGGKSDRVETLLFGTFHMASTSDSYQSPYNADNPERREEIEVLVDKLAKFEPTVICVEVPPEKQNALDSLYNDYLANPDSIGKGAGELELIAFQLAHEAGLQKVHGIDHKLGYNYMAIHKLADSLDASVYNDYFNNRFEEHKKKDAQIMADSNTTAIMRWINHDEQLNFVRKLNADIMTHVNSPGEFQGADTAAVYYKRNLRIYANLNRLPLDPSDRVFILMGSSHIAFLEMFMKGSPRYNAVSTLKYLK